MLPFTSLRGISGGLATLPFNPIANLGSSPGKEVAENAYTPASRLKECGYYDVQKLQEICRSLVYALSTASVENSTGGLFNQPSTDVDDMKKEMIDYVQSQIDAYARSSPVRNSTSDPVKLIQELLESFVNSKKTLFRRVSSKLNLFGEKQDEQIEIFVQKIEKRGCWVTKERESTAKSFLKKVDKSSMHHCERMFESIEELVQHKRRCPLRPLMCKNTSCGEVIAAVNATTHDETCPMKILACHQKCGSMVMRADMDIHTSTLCPMKPIPCPFHEVGCNEMLTQSLVEHHCSQSTSAHLSLILQAFLRQQATVKNHEQQILSLEKILSYVQFAEAADIGAMAMSMTEQEVKVKVLEQEMAKLRQELKLVDVSADVLQLRREIRNLRKGQGVSSP